MVNVGCWRPRYLSKKRPERAEINGAHAIAAFNEGGFLLLGKGAGSRPELETKLLELHHGARVQRAVRQKGLG
jgi:hypothetical protein